MGSRGTILPLPLPLSLLRRVSPPLSQVLSLSQFVVLLCAPSVDHVRIRRDIPPPPGVFTKAVPLILILLHIALQIAGKRA